MQPPEPSGVIDPDEVGTRNALSLKKFHGSSWLSSGVRIQKAGTGQSQVADGHSKGIKYKSLFKSVAIYLALIPLVFVAFRVFEPTCSSVDVDNYVKDIVEAKLLHLQKFSVGLANIEAIDHDIFGDEKCSANLVIYGITTPRRVEYHWVMRRNSVKTVYAKMVQ